MVTVVGVRFRKAGKIYYFNPGDLQMAAGDGCIVETARGVEFGRVVIGPREVPEEEVVQPLKQVIRSATSEDYQRVEENKRRAQEAFQIALRKIAEHGLPMKLLEAEYTLDESKLIFSFTADGRVDFRELVKDLASIFRTRIELRQVGVRDEAKLIGGLGPCGRDLCCATFLGEFEPVSIRMAKDQNLSLNPSKISGLCGRLMCCLKYECEAYREFKETFGEGVPELLPEEFYEDVESEDDYYTELLQVDGVAEVDYQLMVEAAEIERVVAEEPEEPAKRKKSRSKKRRSSKGSKKKERKAKDKEPKAEEAAAEAKPAAQGKKAPGSKKKRRPRRKKPKAQQEAKAE
ncbi:MAG: stage 0 sporulation family protein [Limnochordia bacterium]